ncbi:U-scoloptoxin(11)-Sm5a-like isoform X2 [Scylla paramamosain]|uniref:U-scoloptoxin(11)-Sm5a-like isoform X2 n=1 Tax=Scylla paramamosain TaxID=85552 RepID=UPI0030827895
MAKKNGSSNMAHPAVRGKATPLRATTVMAFMLLILVTVTASSETNSNPSDVLRHLVKGTYLLYTNGRRSERDLPVCASEAEACNLAHRRYWLIPITERLCRCKDRSECPLHFTNLQDPLAQHVTNRGQLKFCSSSIEKLSQCKEGEVALRMQLVRRLNAPPYSSSTPSEIIDPHTTLLCRCPWPYAWSLTNATASATSSEHTYLYTCHELPMCRRGDKCGYIREDTLETYYTCSCPEQQLCMFRGPQSTVTTSQLHYYGKAYIGRCTPR